MTGLILKDFLSIKRQARIFILLALLYVVMACFSNDSAFFMGFVIILSSMMPITALAYDERAHFERYALTMPLSRRDVVIAKYLFGLLCIGIALLVSFIFDIIMSIVTSASISPDLFISLLVLMSVTLLFLSVNLPVMFKFGTEKGRLIYMGLAVLAMLLPTLFQNGIIGPPSAMLLKTLVYTFPAFSVLCFLLSIRISIGIYGKKEFS